MASTLNYFRLLLLSLCGMFLLCTAFAADPNIANGLVMGKVCWFHFTMLFFAGSVLFTGFTMPGKLFSFSITDGLLLLLTGIVLITYNWSLNPEPEKLIFGGQLVMLWFMLRYVLTAYPSLRSLYLSILICTGLLEAIWGMGQLHGLSSSNHSLFRLTGSFFNPGPFSGYLAVVLPLTLGFVLRLSHCRKATWWQMWTALYYFTWACLVVILIVLPAGMSRSAWIAAIVSCGWVYWAKRIGWKKSKAYIQQHLGMAAVCFIVAIIAMGSAMTGIYLMKQDSANGRFLMWNITTKTIMKEPLGGVGLGGFPAAYAQTQAEYFTSGAATESERMVAGCPEYAFNEYLQIGAEQGVLGLIVFFLWIGYSFYAGVKNRLFGTSGAILALTVFAVSSYPLQLPSFWVVLVFLGAICVTGKEEKDNTPSTPSQEEKGYFRMVVVILLAGGSVGLFALQKGDYEVYKSWNRVKMLYNSKAYEVALPEYKELEERLNHKPEFLFEKAQCMSKGGDYAEANKLLRRATKLSGDPMLYYMMAKNEQELGGYEEAERLLLYAIDILPERLYPYYLLVKLYASPDFYQEEKLREAAYAVLTKEPKVENTAIREMREEVKKILYKNEVKN